MPEPFHPVRRGGPHGGRAGRVDRLLAARGGVRRDLAVRHAEVLRRGGPHSGRAGGADRLLAARGGVRRDLAVRHAEVLQVRKCVADGGQKTTAKWPKIF